MHSIRDVLSTHTQAEVLVQLEYEFTFLMGNDEELDRFYQKCKLITDIWNLTDSVSFSILSILFNII